MPTLGHGLDGGRVDLVGGLGTGGADLDPAPGKGGEERGGHLGAAGVVDADEQDGGLLGWVGGHGGLLGWRSERGIAGRKRYVAHRPAYSSATRAGGSIKRPMGQAALASLEFLSTCHDLKGV